MSLLGFDALGHWALGHPPDPAQSITLTASVGSFSLTGQATSFTFGVPDSVGSFALTGITEAFSISEAASVGAFTLTGQAATFSLLQVQSVGSFALTGQATTDSIVDPVLGGVFSLSGQATTFTLTEATGTGSFAVSTTTSGITMEADASASFVLTGNDAALGVFLFGGAGDGGRSHSIEEDWEKYAANRKALHNSIRRARRRVEYGPDGPIFAPAPHVPRSRSDEPFRAPQINLNFAPLTAALAAIEANLQTLQAALQPRPAPEPEPTASPAVAEPDFANEDEAIAALLRDPNGTPLALEPETVETLLQGEYPDEDHAIAALLAA